ncbi:MAG: cytidine deaminase [Rubricoccaceae bacterium]
MSLSAADQHLLELARDVIARRGKEDVHEIGAALRTRSGQTFAAVHLEAYVGRVAVCAEAIALGMAAAAGDTDIETVVAVRRSGDVVSPCGMCRELVLDYAPSATVIVPEGDELVAIELAQLLPRKYSRGA